MNLLNVLLGNVAYAQDMGGEVGPATFIGSYTLWIAIVIGLIASFLTIRYAQQMKGSTVGQTLSLFGFGMFFVVLGFLAVVVKWSTEPVQMITHDLLFILGYVLLLLGVFKVRKLSV